MSVINVLMQLRKVCNHPDLFEPRPVHSPFITEGICFVTASLVLRALDPDPFKVTHRGDASGARGGGPWKGFLGAGGTRRWFEVASGDLVGSPALGWPSGGVCGEVEDNGVRRVKDSRSS